MRDIELKGYYKREKDGLPSFVYEVELVDGADFNGKFGVQFAAVQNSDAEGAFAIVIRGQAPFVLDWDDAAKELVDDLIEHEEFFACINYENKEWEEPFGGYSTMVMGRDVGREFDIVQRRNLGEQDVAALREIRKALNEMP